MSKVFTFPSSSSQPFSIESVSMRELDADDFRYALAAYDVTAIANSRVTLLRLQNDLVRCAITHVNGVTVERPYLPLETFLNWTLRTINLLRVGFEDVNDEEHLEMLCRQCLGEKPPTPMGNA